MPYGLLQRELGTMAAPGVKRAMKSAFFDGLSDEFIGNITEAFKSAPTADTAMLLEHYGGAANRIAADAKAYPHRDAEFNLVIDAGWRNHSEGRDACYWLANTWNGVRPLVNKAAYVSFLDADDSGRGAEAYGEANFARLRDLKLQYDPEAHSGDVARSDCRVSGLSDCVHTWMRAGSVSSHVGRHCLPERV